MRVAPGVILQYISLASIVLKDKGIMMLSGSCNCSSRTATMRAATAFARPGFGRQLPAPAAAAAAAGRSGSGGRGSAVRVRPWQRMFCTSNDQQQHLQQHQHVKQHREPQQHQQEQPPRHQMNELNGGATTTGTPLACSTSSTSKQQQQQQQQEGLGELLSNSNPPCGGVKLDTAGLLELDRKVPLVHSNPDIQVLLDRYTRLCENEEDVQAVSPTFGKADRRSPSRAVFSNTNVDLSRVEVVGFDYDYTLATCEFVLFFFVTRVFHSIYSISCCFTRWSQPGKQLAAVLFVPLIYTAVFTA